MKDFWNRLKPPLKPRLKNMWRNSPPAILRTIHMVWVGDENKRPDNCIETWRRKNPGWVVRIWGNRELTSLEWHNHKHMSEMLNCQAWDGVADLMRWEILDRLGGFAMDADGICIRSLEDWLFEPQIFACWENEANNPGLIANGYVYSHPGNPLIRQVIDDIYDLPNVRGPACRLTGPHRLTQTFLRMRYTGLTIYPSHYFLPTYNNGVNYTGTGPVFAEQFWASYRHLYDHLSHIDLTRIETRIRRG